MMMDVQSHLDHSKAGQNELYEPLNCICCSLIFGDRNEWNSHILTHFLQQTCSNCDKNLLQIGDNWYELHVSIDCTKIKCEDFSPEYTEETIATESIVKTEPQEENENEEEEASHIKQIEEVLVTPTEVRLTAESENTKKEEKEKKSRYSSGKQFTCNYCDKSWPAKYLLVEHIYTHTGEKPYTCDICQTTFRQRSTLYTHKQSHGEKTYLCTIEGCGRAFIRAEKLTSHLNVHAGIRPYKCDICDKSYSSNNALQMHRRTVHVKKIVRTKEKLFKCSMENCEKKFRSNASLNTHMLEHDEEAERFECDACPASFITNLRLIRHQRELHSNERFNCTIEGCGKVFKIEKKLQMHLNLHAGIKPYSCDVCGIAYSLYSSLHYHKKTHVKKQTGNVEKFKCSFEGCKKAFIRQSSLNIHILEHDPNPAERFECDSCKASFLTIYRLRAHHQHMHSNSDGFICSVCGGTFRTKARLKEHIRSHTGEKPYKCVECFKSFGRLMHLKAHKLIHTGEKPHKCTIEGCDRAYMYAIDLKRHKFSAHGIYTKQHPCTICDKIFPENKILRRHLETHK